MKKIGLIIIALVVMMGSLGVGYALWGQNLYVNGTAQTGSLTAIFVDSDVTGAPCGDYLNSATYDISGSGTDTVTVTLHNTYPGMQSFFYVTVKNTGTIPINTIYFDGPADTSNLPAGSVFGATDFEPEIKPGSPLPVNAVTTAELTVYIPEDATESTFNEGYTGTDYSFSGTIRANQ